MWAEPPAPNKWLRCQPCYCAAVTYSRRFHQLKENEKMKLNTGKKR